MTKKVFYRPQRARMRSYFDKFRGPVPDNDPYVREEKPDPLVISRMEGLGSSIRGSSTNRHDLILIGRGNTRVPRGQSQLTVSVSFDRVVFETSSDEEYVTLQNAARGYCQKRGRSTGAGSYEAIDWDDFVDFLQRMGGTLIPKDESK